MGTCRVIAEADAVVGFRLAGVETVAAAGPEEAERLLQTWITEGGSAVVLVTQALLDGFSEATRRRLEKLSVPLVIPLPLVPAWQKEKPSQDYILSLIRRAIGYQMKITR